MRSTRSPMARPATAAAVVLAAAMQLPAIAQPASSASFNPHNFKFPVGVYRCELNRSVDVRQVAPDMTSAVLSFGKKEYRMKAVHARSGALRYEDDQAGVVWLIIAGKSMLLDTRHGKQLANECRT